MLLDSIHWFHVTDRKPAGFKHFTDVKEDLKKRISDDLYEKRNGQGGEFLDRLRREAFVRCFWITISRSSMRRSRRPSR